MKLTKKIMATITLLIVMLTLKYAFRFSAEEIQFSLTIWVCLEVIGLSWGD